jgi:hypothetical protein
MSNNGAGNEVDKDQHLDPKGYWIDPARNVRRMSGEQEIIVSARDVCSVVEWNYIFEAIRDCIPKMKV